MIALTDENVHELQEALMKSVGEFARRKGETNVHPGVVATACGVVSGCFCYGISDEMRLTICRDFVERFIEAAGVPLHVEICS
jgi:hypothetical protein